MNLKHSLLAIAMSTVFVSQVQAADAAKQAVVDALASNLVVKYEVVTNDGAGAGLDCQALGSEWASCGVAKLHLTNTGADVTSKDWSIYVSSIRRIQRVDNDQFTITHLTGDLYRLTPTEKFQALPRMPRSKCRWWWSTGYCSNLTSCRTGMSPAKGPSRKCWPA